MNTLIVFAKEPTLGYVKTRLANDTSSEIALMLYKSFLKDTIACACQVPDVKRILAWASTNEPHFLKELASDFELYKQVSGDLGAKMYHAFLYANKIGSHKIVIIGSDAPTLPGAFIDQAFVRLDQHDVVIGPSDDGGYYLIGLKVPDQSLFNNIDWSVPTTREQTLEKIRQLGKSVCLLPQWFDVDTLDDVRVLKESLVRDLSVGIHTRETLEKINSLL